MAQRITVVVSQGQSSHPAKRGLEEDIVAALLMENGIDVTVVPHLYDLAPDSTGMLALQGISGHMVVLAWLFERGAFWTLDRNGIRGQLGETLLRSEDEDEEQEDAAAEEQAKERVNDTRPLPQRKIYCLDLRLHETAQPYVDEVKRIAAESGRQVVDLMGWINGSPRADQLQRFAQPTNTTSLGEPGNNGAGNNGAGNNGAGTPPSDRDHQTSGPDQQPADEAEAHAAADSAAADSAAAARADGSAQPVRIEEQADRRWYPVIDFSRCTNCMECIDFCLFGVYGVDGSETILVEQPDNCRKGCPACSRVCPENAIIFPQHKTPAIAGAAVEISSLKIDLSQLFGAPDKKESAVDVAARERDEQLLLAGRDAVGLSVGIPKRQEGKQPGPKDDLDDLLDELDELDL